jgi:hypothetical protein
MVAVEVGVLRGVVLGRTVGEGEGAAEEAPGRSSPVVARATPYPSAEVPRTTVAAIATVVTRPTPGLMCHILR